MIIQVVDQANKSGQANTGLMKFVLEPSNNSTQTMSSSSSMPSINADNCSINDSTTDTISPSSPLTNSQIMCGNIRYMKENKIFKKRLHATMLILG
jgi:hypothetical protein